MILNMRLHWRGCATLCAMDISLTPRHLREACAAWRDGGTLALGAWLARYKPRFSTKDYSDLVQLVREELQDYTDYSKEQLHEG